MNLARGRSRTLARRSLGRQSSLVERTYLYIVCALNNFGSSSAQAHSGPEPECVVDRYKHLLYFKFKEEYSNDYERSDCRYAYKNP